jgi:hypothetical protein
MADADRGDESRRGKRRSPLRTAILAASGCAALALAVFFSWPAIEGLLVPGVFSKTGSFLLRDRPVHSLLVSADEKVLAYVAANARGEEYLVLRRGEWIYTGRAWPAIRDLAISSDGSRWAYIAVSDPSGKAGKDGAAGRVVTGRARGGSGTADCETEGEGFGFVGSLHLSRNGRRVAFVAGSGGIWRATAGKGLRYGGGTMSVIFDGTRSEPCDRATFLAMSADGRHVAWAERRGIDWKELAGGGWDATGGSSLVMKDGRRLLECDLVDFLAMSPGDGRTVSLVAAGGAWARDADGPSILVGGKEVFYADGQARGSYDWCGPVAASADISTWAFVAGRGGEWTQTTAGTWAYGAGRWLVVTEAGEGGLHDAILSFEASSDGGTYVCEAGDGGEWRRASDGSWAYGIGRWQVLGRGISIDLEHRPGGLALSASGRHFAFYYPVSILNYDENDLGWWYSPADRPLRLSVDGELRDGEYAAIASLAIDDSAVYIRCRLSSLGPEETQVLPFGGQREDEPAGLSSRIIVDAKGKRRLWIASEGAAYRLVVEEIVKTGEPR